MFIIANIHTGGFVYLGEVGITVIIKLSYRLHQKKVAEGDGKQFQSHQIRLDC